MAPNLSGQFEPEKAYLLWRTMNRFKEVREGLIHLNKEMSIRMFKNNPDGFLSLDPEKFIKNCLSLLGNQVTPEKEKTIKALIAKIFDSFRKEIVYITNRKEQFSMDILFSVIETVIMEAGSSKAESAVLELQNQKSSITKQDLEQILDYLKAYNKMQARYLACGNIKKAIESSDDIISITASEHLQIPILALDIMFNLITAQYVLSQKYTCKDLILGWKKEYGFGEEETKKIVTLFPPQSSLMDFRNLYTNAIKTIQNRIQSGDPTAEMDLFVLRTLSNYYTSWINQIANQISKKEN